MIKMPLDPNPLDPILKMPMDKFYDLAQWPISGTPLPSTMLG